MYGLLTKFAKSRWLDIGQVLFLRDEVEVHKIAKKERGQYPAILTAQTNTASTERARWLHLARSCSQSHHAIWFILLARGVSHIINYVNAISAMLCYMLCYVMLCYAMLCYALLCFAMLCYAMLCYMSCYAMLCYRVCYAIIYICYFPA